MSVITAEQSAAIVACQNAGCLTESVALAILGNVAVPTAEPVVKSSKTANSAATRKAKARKAQQPKAERHTATPRKAAPKAQPARKARQKGVVSLADRLAQMSTEAGSITAGQLRRITDVSNEHGFEVLPMADWSMRMAGQYYADLVAEVEAA